MLETLKLARRRHRSADDYRAMQEYIACGAVKELYRRGIDIAACDVLELAAGRGGYSKVLNAKAKSFLANDLKPDGFFAEQGIAFESFDVAQPFPLASGSFDLIYCSSLIEHLRDPRSLLRECKRVLRPSGTLYLTFPPFYSLAMVGGHGFQPFHFLGEKLALRMHNWRHGRSIESYATLWGDWGLYPCTITGVAGLIADGGFDIFDTYTRLSPINTTRLPGILKDLATWHVCYLGRPRSDDQVAPG